MTFKIFPKSLDWWFWMVTLGLIVAALAGWAPGFYGAVAVSALNLGFKVVQKSSLTAFAVQTRLESSSHIAMRLGEAGAGLASNFSPRGCGCG